MNNDNEWYHRYCHDNDVNNVYAIMNGDPTPKQEVGRIYLVKYPRQYNGRLFRELLDNRGHSTAVYETCMCRKNQHQ